MFTVCPKCALTLVVTAQDLRVAQGYVRCGRCSNVFNAIVGLSEDRTGSASGGAPAPNSTASTSIMRKAPALADDEDVHDPLSTTGESEAIYAEPDTEEVTFQEVFVEPPPPPAEPEIEAIPDTSLEFNPAADATQVFIEATPDDKGEPTGTFETIVLRTEEPPPREIQRDPEDIQLESELRSLAARIDATGNTPAPKLLAANDATVEANSAGDVYSRARAALPSSTPKPVPAAQGRGTSRASDSYRRPPAQPVEQPDDAEISAAAAQALSETAAPRSRRTLWIVGAAALCVVLAAQFIHHNRHDLATNVRLNRPLTRFYAAIGVPLIPRWDLSSYEVRQLGASGGAGDSGNLTVRASLKNSSTQPLPLPLLRITVQDRYGNRIATRDVAPRGYVSGGLPADAHLGVGQRIDAEMTFKDPGPDAVGFEIDACLPTPENRIACANDVAAR